MWRKTRSTNAGSSCFGADPNRNFGYQYNTGGSSSNPCTETYRGSKAFSEPETKAISDYITKTNTNNRYKIYVNVHSYSQLWLYPWVRFN